MRNHSARAQRKARHYGRRKKVSALNLTALMDIFTILVFFLLVNQTNVQQPPDDPDIVLPQSIAQEVPDEMLTIQVSSRSIMVQDRFVVSVDDALEGDERVIPALVEVLDGYAQRAMRLGAAEDRELMILADRNVSYALLRRIMFSANQTEYSTVSFAVLRTDAEAGDE